MKKILITFLCFTLLFNVYLPSFAIDGSSINTIINDAAEYIFKTVTNPNVGSVGGEWAVLGLARSGVDIPKEYYQNYYSNVEKYVKNSGGVLHDKKYTEYSRVILALTAIGKNPEDVAGFNLLTPLGDYEKTIWQGINGAIWALIALDSGNYEMPRNPDTKVQATREMYINHILENQTSGGGWALSGDVADPDITAMALQALAKYQTVEKVKTATEKALSIISDMQQENGGFESYDTENSESCVQILVALSALGISPDDERFVKNGNTLLDYLLTYYSPKKGFKHIKSEADTNLMATEQSLYALVAVNRFLGGKSSLYRITDAALSLDSKNSRDVGLTGKNADVTKMDIVSPDKTFTDINSHESKAAISALAARNIISGKTENTFEPDSRVTRAEFAAIIVKGLGLPQKSGSQFHDVTINDWFYIYVNTAYSYGIINGISKTEFNPSGTITREEAAVMLTRAAKLCGMDTEFEASHARDILAGFTDYVTASGWATTSLTFCYDAGILPDEAMEIKPKEAALRAEIAQMLYNMLSLAELL